jgi:hypothetical protein
MADAVAPHADQRSNQRADVEQRAEDREHQHRAGLGQHVPAENDRLHLERPRDQEIGWPLEAIAADAKGGEQTGGIHVTKD